MNAVWENRHRIYRYSPSRTPTHFRSNALQEAWSLSPILFFLIVLVNVVGYVLALMLVYLLANVIGSSSAPLPTVYAGHVIAFLFIILANLILWLAQIEIDNAFSLRICQKIEGVLILSKPSLSSAAAMERLVARDVNVLLDNLVPALGLVGIPIFLISLTTFTLLTIGTAGPFISLIWLVFLPISYFIARYSSKNFEAILVQTGKRIEHCSRWLSVGPVLRQFGLTADLDVIRSGLKSELRLRDRDSALRGIDSYLIGFGRLLPIALLAWIGLDLPLDVSNGSARWLAVPILAATLHLSRGYVAFKCASHALGALRATVPIGEAETALRFKAVNGLPPTIPFEFDDAWPIWPGSIANNLPSLELVNRTDLDALLRATRLLPELGGSVDAVLAKHITLDGTNLSSGQHCRLQIVRP